MSFSVTSASWKMLPLFTARKQCYCYNCSGFAKKVLYVFSSFPYHSQSTFLEIKSGTCWWMQVLFRNMTTCHHPVSCYQATAGNICLAWNIFCTVLPSKVCPLSSPRQKNSVLEPLGVEVLLFNTGKFHGCGGRLACCEDGGGQQCGFRPPRL